MRSRSETAEDQVSPQRSNDRWNKIEVGTEITEVTLDTGISPCTEYNLQLRADTAFFGLGRIKTGPRGIGRLTLGPLAIADDGGGSAVLKWELEGNSSKCYEGLTLTQRWRNGDDIAISERKLVNGRVMCGIKSIFGRGNFTFTVTALYGGVNKPSFEFEMVS